MGRYDAVSKHLIEGRPRDWLTLAKLPRGRSVRVVDTDLSTVTAIPDKLVRVAGGPAGSYLAHVEFQSGRDPDLDRRVLMYNVLAGWHHQLPVRSVVFLLKRSAGPPSVLGRVCEANDPHARLEFDYRLIRAWDLPGDELLSGGLGTLPLAPISAVPKGDLPRVLRRVHQRLTREAEPPEVAELWTATGILLTLRYNRPFAIGLLQGVRTMRESWLYQDILKEGRVEGRVQGRVEGRVEGERNLLIHLGTHKFGNADAGVLARLGAIGDVAQLKRLGLAVLTADSWEELFSQGSKRRRRSPRAVRPSK